MGRLTFAEACNSVCENAWLKDLAEGRGDTKDWRAALNHDILQAQKVADHLAADLTLLASGRDYRFVRKFHFRFPLNGFLSKYIPNDQAVDLTTSQLAFLHKEFRFSFERYICDVLCRINNHDGRPFGAFYMTGSRMFGFPDVGGRIFHYRHSQGLEGAEVPSFVEKTTIRKLRHTHFDYREQVFDCQDGGPNGLCIDLGQSFYVVTDLWSRITGRDMGPGDDMKSFFVKMAAFSSLVIASLLSLSHNHAVMFMCFILLAVGVLVPLLGFTALYLTRSSRIIRI